MLSSDGVFFTVKESRGSSGTPEPDPSPVRPHFSHSQNFRGHNPEKCGTGPELLADPRRELKRSNMAIVWRTKAGGEVVWDAAGTGRGMWLHPHRERPG